MKTEVKMTEYRCDAQRCNTVHYVEVGEEPPYGFHGTVIQIDQWGGNGGEWYACKEGHIKDAVIQAIAHSYDRDEKPETRSG